MPSPAKRQSLQSLLYSAAPYGAWLDYVRDTKTGKETPVIRFPDAKAKAAWIATRSAPPKPSLRLITSNIGAGI